MLRRLIFTLQGNQARCFNLIRDRVHGDGIEIGGPTEMFQDRQELPVYPLVSSLENYGFDAPEGDFEYGGRKGRSHRCDSTTLPRSDASSDFVLSCHMLEHVANPLKALKEWQRVLKPSGYLLLVLPDAEHTFDHRRQTTTLEHLIADYRNHTSEDDATHIQEVLALTDMQHWSFPKDWYEWRDIYLRNSEHRQVHQHVFNAELAAAAVRFAGFNILACERLFPINIVVFAQKPALGVELA
jgi:ubiquinone/menaquinone biosynthesis C-methylase UbiE